MSACDYVCVSVRKFDTDRSHFTEHVQLGSSGSCVIKTGWLIFVNMGDLGLVVCLISAPGIRGTNAAFFVRFQHPESVKLKLGYYCAVVST